MASRVVGRNAAAPPAGGWAGGGGGRVGTATSIHGGWTARIQPAGGAPLHSCAPAPRAIIASRRPMTDSTPDSELRDLEEKRCSTGLTPAEEARRTELASAPP